MPFIAEQLTALERIAVFSAKLRGHELGKWRRGEGFSVARCIRCRAQLRVYCSPIQPEMDGAALNARCREKAAEQVA